MNLNQLKNLYSSSPYFIKKVYSLIPFGMRNGPEYCKWFRILNLDVRGYKRDPFESYYYAKNNFEFYRNLYANKNFERWEDIPLIEKSQIQLSLWEFEKMEIPKFYVTTGGVTGKPAKFFQSNNVWYKELAFLYHFFSLYDYNPKDLKASFRGGDFSVLKPGIYWKFEPNYNDIHFSPFHLNEVSVEEYVKQLNSSKPKFFHGYPSAFLSLARLMQKKELNLNYVPKAFYLISEGININDVKFLESFFECKIASFYGHSERLIFAIAEEDLQNYKPNLDYGYVELVDPDGKVITENDVLGELVGTSYDNKAMPLVRYKTGDYTYYTDYKTKTFGPIQGKWGQICLFGINGEEISLTALNLHSEELNNVLKIQFIQYERGKVTIRLMFSSPKSIKEIIKLERMLSNRVGNLIQFKIENVDTFILNERGKAPMIIQKSDS